MTTAQSARLGNRRVELGRTSRPRRGDEGRAHRRADRRGSRSRREIACWNSGPVPARSRCGWRAVRPGGSVLASDVAPGMVELIRASAAGHPGDRGGADRCVRHRARRRGPFDAIAFRMGLMLLPEPARALAECRRVLAPGGRIAIAVWAGPQFNPWLTTVGISAMMQGLMPAGPPTGPGNPFSLADPGEFEAVVTAAGFTDVDVRAIDGSRRSRRPTSTSTPCASWHHRWPRRCRARRPRCLPRCARQPRACWRSSDTDDGLRIPLRALLYRPPHLTRAPGGGAKCLEWRMSRHSPP